MKLNFLENRRFWHFVYIAFVVLWCIFIFSNSLESAEQSSGKSRGVLEVIEQAVQKIVPEFELSHHLVRKAAHFIEFFVLGSLLSASLFIYRLKPEAVLYKTSFICLLVAMIDETLQLFSPGREGAVVDVWLDFSAIIVSHLLFFVIYVVIHTMKRQKSL